MESSKVEPSSATMNKSLMRDFWSKYRKKVYIVITAAQCSVVAIILLALQLAGLVRLDIYSFAAIALLASSALNLVTITLIHILGAPFRDLVSAIVLTTGEPSASAPPNPNKYDYDSDGFREVIQTVYELASHEGVAVQSSEPVNNHVQAGLNNTSTGIVMLDKNQNITYRNHSAPTHKSTENKDILDLVFPDDDTLENWLNKTVKNKLSAERTWLRISDKLPGEKDRRIFDIAASYHKNSAVETVLTLFERTEDNLPMLGTAGCTDAKIMGVQTGLEAASQCLSSALFGANMVHDVGLMDHATMISPELMVLTDEMIEMTRVMLRRLEVNDESLALDLVDKVGPGGSYLAEDHTFENFRSFWVPEILDRSMGIKPGASGAPVHSEELLREKTLKILENHTPDPLDKDLLSEIKTLEKSWFERLGLDHVYPEA